MNQINIKIPGLGDVDGISPIVILGPNGSGKTQLAQKIAGSNQVSAVSAQRRTWVDDNLPVQTKENLRSNVQSYMNRWRKNSWQPTEEINFILSTLIQDHTNILTQKNEEAINSGKPLDPVKDTNLILLQNLWNRLFPKRKLEIGGFFPKVKRLDAPKEAASYQLRQMSDGERTVLYMAARVMTAEHPIILVDEPELHMHSRLAVQFWDEAEKLRQDCRFVYITHDLNFTLSRQRATLIIARSSDSAEKLVAVDQLPSSIAADVLGAATLPFYAKRIFLYEGEPGKGFASEFFSAWFDDEETFSIPCGNRDSVCAAVSGLKAVGIVSAEVIGLIDRDFYPDLILDRVTEGVTVLQLHEIESVLCDQAVVESVATHFGKASENVWEIFLDRVRSTFRDQTFNGVVARRVRSRVGDLLDGAFKGAQVVSDLNTTSMNHSRTIADLDLPKKMETMFDEESKRVKEALSNGGKQLLAILPGKHLLSILADVLGLKYTSELTNIVIKALNGKQLKTNDSLRTLGSEIEDALLAYLPPRKSPNMANSADVKSHAAD